MAASPSSSGAYSHLLVLALPIVPTIVRPLAADTSAAASVSQAFPVPGFVAGVPSGLVPVGAGRSDALDPAAPLVPPAAPPDAAPFEPAAPAPFDAPDPVPSATSGP